MPETRTYADRAEYLKKAVAKRRKKLREMALEYGGGKCAICGYNKCRRAMVFHHIDPTKKDFGLSVRGLTRSWEKMRAELEKMYSTLRKLPRRSARQHYAASTK